MKKTYYITDGSYALAICEKGLKPMSGLELGGVQNCNQPQTRKFEIVATNCDLPADDPFKDGSLRRCDTIVRCVETGEIVFTKERFLRKAYKACPHCGENIDQR